jgi:hypothetical protein
MSKVIGVMLRRTRARTPLKCTAISFLHATFAQPLSR